MISNRDVAVIGGGLHGLSAALHLARMGQRVVVLEKAWSGRHASGATAAGVRSLGRDMAELDIAIEALDMWHNIGKLVGDNCGFAASGQLRLAEDEEALTVLMAEVDELRLRGYGHTFMIDADEVARRVPALSAKVRGAQFVPTDGAADPHKTLAAFKSSALKAGVEIREGCGVEAIERCGADWRIIGTNGVSTVASTIVNAAGAWGSRIASMVGDEIPLALKASMMIVTERLQPFLGPVIGSYGRQLSLKQAEQGGLVIGGGIQGVPDLDAETSHVRFGRLAAGARHATTLFSCIEGVRIVRAWAGLEATTVDHIPIIGPSMNAPRFYHAYGFSGHGFALVPVVGAILADLIVTGTTRRNIDGLQAGRLMGDVENKGGVQPTHRLALIGGRSSDARLIGWK